MRGRDGTGVAVLTRVARPMAEEGRPYRNRAGVQAGRPIEGWSAGPRLDPVLATLGEAADRAKAFVVKIAPA